MTERGRRNVVLLFLCQALSFSMTSAMTTTSALVGYALAENKGLATLGAGFQFLATMATSMPASLFMRRFGRRAGFLAGAAIGTAAGLVLTLSLFLASFWVFCAGSALLGVAVGVANFYRFTAAEVADDAFRTRAIALVMAGGVVSAILGPELVKWTKDLVAPVLFAGSYMAIAALPLAVMLILALVRLPRIEARGREGGGEARPLHVVARQPAFLAALASAMAAWGVMNLVMTSTPLAMVACSFAVVDAAWIIQWHAVAMYLPSFATGHLIQRLGVLNVMLLGVGLNLLCVLVNASGQTITHFWGGLVLLGVGWNFMFVGATTLVTYAYRPAEKAKAQGFNDLLVFGTVALTAMLSGAVHHYVGWTGLNLATLPALGLALAALLWARLGRAAPAA
ncbi:MAG: MFS transporter [Proteobacteria bacterium]|nr:MFS transporter [Pseudomonadota bacterium]